MNNKGFTLVELLAVITILLSLSIVVVTNVTASLKRSETQEENTQKKIVINAAKIYFSNNNKMSETEYVQISVLITGGYIDEEEVDKLNVNNYVVYCSNKTGYGINSSTSRNCSD